MVVGQDRWRPVARRPTAESATRLPPFPTFAGHLALALTDDEGLMAHELEVFLRQVEDELSSEYERILARAREDPGTAGDEGEENWASFLRTWLPSTYHVVTKGRILSVDGEASPQVDVIVLKPSYPPALRNKKVYLAAGVAAAFECKTTLRKGHIKAAVDTAASIQRLAHPEPPRSTRHGTPYMELHGAIVYGVLAHSHGWTAETAQEHITSALDAGLRSAAHPREVLDVTCVADVGTWNAMRMSYFGPQLNVWQVDELREVFPSGYASCVVFGPADPEDFKSTEDAFPDIPVAKLCAYLTMRLAWEDPAMRGLADYFRVVGMFGTGSGSVQPWPLESVYTEEVVRQLRAGNVRPEPWSEWRITFG